MLESFLSIAFDVKQYTSTRITSLYPDMMPEVCLYQYPFIQVYTLGEEAEEEMKEGKQSSEQESRIDINDCVYESILFR